MSPSLNPQFLPLTFSISFTQIVFPIQVCFVHLIQIYIQIFSPSNFSLIYLFRKLFNRPYSRTTGQKYFFSFFNFFFFYYFNFKSFSNHQSTTIEALFCRTLSINIGVTYLIQQQQNPNKIFSLINLIFFTKKSRINFFPIDCYDSFSFWLLFNLSEKEKKKVLALFCFGLNTRNCYGWPRKQGESERERDREASEKEQTPGCVRTHHQTPRTLTAHNLIMEPIKQWKCG